MAGPTACQSLQVMPHAIPVMPHAIPVPHSHAHNRNME